MSCKNQSQLDDLNAAVAAATREPVAVLLVGHGTRSTTGTAQFLELAAQITKRIAPLRLEPAFLEIQQPDIDAALDRLLKADVQAVVIAPLLLFAAGHAKEDIPSQVRAALARRGRQCIPCTQSPHLGCHSKLVELSQQRMLEGIGAGKAPTQDEDLLVLVGRGSRDASATAEMHEFARLRQQLAGGIATEIAFLAMAEPRLEAALGTAAQSAYRRIIVQPHLLFAGELAESLQQQVTTASKRCPDKEWLITPLLADKLGTETARGQLLQNVIFARLQDAVIRVVAHRAGD